MFGINLFVLLRIILRTLALIYSGPFPIKLEIDELINNSEPAIAITNFNIEIWVLTARGNYLSTDV